MNRLKVSGPEKHLIVNHQVETLVYLHVSSSYMMPFGFGQQVLTDGVVCGWVRLAVVTVKQGYKSAAAAQSVHANKGRGKEEVENASYGGALTAKKCFVKLY